MFWDGESHRAFVFLYHRLYCLSHKLPDERIGIRVGSFEDDRRGRCRNIDDVLVAGVSQWIILTKV